MKFFTRPRLENMLGLERERGKADESGRGNLLASERRQPGRLDICQQVFFLQ